MNNQYTDSQQTFVEETASAVNNSTVGNTEEKTTKKTKFTKKKLIIIGGIIIAVVILALIIFIPSEFERVKNDCVQIAGQISYRGDDNFTIDTYPDEYKNMDDLLVSMLLPDAQENALEAIEYANEALGFNGSLYTKMLETSALMGRQSEENNKYKVSWTYHPDDGLEVTYDKK